MTPGHPLLTSRGLYTWTARPSLWPLTWPQGAGLAHLNEGLRSALGVLLWCGIGEGDVRWAVYSHLSLILTSGDVGATELRSLQYKLQIYLDLGSCFSLAF